MENIFIQNLKQPCTNRGVEFKDMGDGSVSLDGIVFESMIDCEDYLLTQPRTDICEGI